MSIIYYEIVLNIVPKFAFFAFWNLKIYIVNVIVYSVINMRRRFFVLVVAMLLFTTVAVSSIF